VSKLSEKVNANAVCANANKVALAKLKQTNMSVPAKANCEVPVNFNRGELIRINIINKLITSNRYPLILTFGDKIIIKSSWLLFL
jgi:hypothetical protein